MNLRPNAKSAQEIQHKFEFYFTALSFTIAGFAVQTGKFSGNWIGDASEFFSWIALGLSGLLGLSRLEYFSVAYSLHDYVTERKIKVNALASDMRSSEFVKDMQVQLNDAEPKLGQLEEDNLRKYRWRKALFIFGMGALIIARFISEMEAHYW